MSAATIQTKFGSGDALYSVRSNNYVGTNRAGCPVLHQGSTSPVASHHARNSAEATDAHQASEKLPSNLWSQHADVHDEMDRKAKALVDGNEESLHNYHLLSLATEDTCCTSSTTSNLSAARNSVGPSTSPPSADTSAQQALGAENSGHTLSISLSSPSAERDVTAKKSLRLSDNDVLQIAINTPLPPPSRLEINPLSSNDVLSCEETRPALSKSALRRLRRKNAEIRAAAAEGRPPVQNDQSMERMKGMTTQAVISQDLQLMEGSDNSANQSPIASMDQRSSSEPSQQYRDPVHKPNGLCSVKEPLTEDAPLLMEEAVVANSNTDSSSNDGNSYDVGQTEGGEAPASSYPSSSDRQNVQQCSIPEATVPLDQRNGENHFQTVEKPLVNESLLFVPQAVSRRNTRGFPTNVGSRLVTANHLTSTLREAEGLRCSTAKITTSQFPVFNTESLSCWNDGRYYRFASPADVATTTPVRGRHFQFQAALKETSFREPIPAIDFAWATGTDMGSHLLLPSADPELQFAYMDKNTPEKDLTVNRPAKKSKVKHGRDAISCVSRAPPDPHEGSVQLQVQIFSPPALDIPRSPSPTDYSEECLERPTIPGVSRCPFHESHRAGAKRSQRKQINEGLFLNTKTFPQRAGTVPVSLPTFPFRNVSGPVVRQEVRGRARNLSI